MKRLITTAAFLAALTIAPVQAQTVDTLLEQVRSGTLQKTKAAIEAEKRFKSAGANKASVVAALSKQRVELEKRSNQLEQQYAANEEALSKVRTARENSLGDLKELFGAIQQAVGESKALFDTSIVSAQFPNRASNFDEISKMYLYQ